MEKNKMKENINLVAQKDCEFVIIFQKGYEFICKGAIEANDQDLIKKLINSGHMFISKNI